MSASTIIDMGGQILSMPRPETQQIATSAGVFAVEQVFRSTGPAATVISMVMDGPPPRHLPY
jgi:hypothetical protein